jgi:alpha-glucosidase
MMKRRDFLTAGASVAAAASLPTLASAQSAADIEEHPIGEFLLRRAGGGLQVSHRRAPQRVLWETAADKNFIIAETATANIRAFGTPEGSYDIRDTVSAAFDRPTIETIAATADGATVSGRLKSASGERGYSLTFEAVSPTHLRFTIGAEAQGGDAVNRIRLRLASSPDEGLFGFGQQLTFFNQKGNRLPILVQEHGVGRGRPVITRLVDVFAQGGGQNPYVTEAPAPHFITSRLRSLFLENTEYSVFDMRTADHLEIKVWSGAMTGRILFGETPLDLIETYSEYAGRMRKLPDWIHEGAIIAVQGGQKAAQTTLDEIRRAEVPLAGFWIQDWVGIRLTSAGEQLWWDWKLDETYYPQWRELVADLASRGARMLIYMNPFLSNAKGHDALFNTGRDKSYLVKKDDGSPYLIKNTDFSAGLLDLTNPETRTWIKGIIKDEMIGKAGASGWMADFGEALPFDGKLHDGVDPAVWHNRYPEEWASVHREAIEEAGRGDDIVFFERSAFTQSPKHATLFWLGDQLQTWDEYDGIKTAVVGVLSGGVSGFSLVHSDIGGYVSLSLNLAGRKFPVIARSNELLQRWMELAAFTAVFRTHAGLDPAVAAQFDSDPANTAHLARFAKVYKGLAGYRKRLVAEAAQRGYPIARHLFLHYPDDPNTHDLRYQFLLGADLLVAPVVDKGADTVEVYFPEGADLWTDLWTGKDVGSAGDWVEISAPLGKPGVFLRKGSPSAGDIVAGLKAEGIL